MTVDKNIRFDDHTLANNPFGGDTATVDLGFNALNYDPAAASITIAYNRFSLRNWPWLRCSFHPNLFQLNIPFA
jgi:hypothetical protein